MVTTYRPRTVDVTGARRRLRALVRVGYPKSTLARRIGISETAVENILSALTRRVNPGTAETVAQVYDELWDVPPDTSTYRRAADGARAKARAEAAGWPPPMAWDDDDLDNPDAPEPSDEREHHSGVDLDEWAFLVRCGEDPDRAAARCGVQLGAIERRAFRQARHDVLTLLRAVRTASAEGVTAWTA